MTLESAKGPALVRGSDGKLVCHRPVRAAEFILPPLPGEPVRYTAILHRSTKREDGWQVSYFTAGSPGKDGVYGSCTDAVRSLPAGYIIRQVIE